MKSLAFSILLFLLPLHGAQAKDLALIIGIDEYTELTDLNKAVEDAVGYRDLFLARGFDVTFLTNPDSATLRIELAQFYNRIAPGDTVVFIYSGHGWNDGAQNYLVPADTPDIPSIAFVTALSVPLKNGVNGVLDRISARDAELTVAVIDASRNSPFSGAGTRVVGIIGGLAPIEPPSGTFIVYSAASNQTALDGLGKTDTQQYSVFTRFFLPNLRDMGDLRKAIVQTQSQVRAAAAIINHVQRPAYYDELTGHACLFGDCVSHTPLAVQVTQPVIETIIPDASELTSGELIFMLQTALNENNCNAGTADGVYGPKSARATALFNVVKPASCAALTPLNMTNNAITDDVTYQAALQNLRDLNSCTPQACGEDRGPDWYRDLTAGCYYFASSVSPYEYATWSGECDQNGYATGQGMLQYTYPRAVPDRYVDYYEGSLCAGLRCNTGKLVLLNGTTGYDGQYLNDLRNGYGVQVYQNGSSYSGQWRNGVRQGQGIHTYSDGGSYSGAFFENKSHGNGTLTYASGDVLSGEWRHGEITGPAIVRWTTGEVSAQNFENGELHGLEIITNINGSTRSRMWNHGEQVN